MRKSRAPEPGPIDVQITLWIVRQRIIDERLIFIKAHATEMCQQLVGMAAMLRQGRLQWTILAPQ
jgi:hypothetical protein